MTKPEAEESLHTRRFLYSGRVQGVGFRYTTAKIAKSYPVNGYVKNLANGNVELVVSGTEARLSAFTEEVARVMAGNISECRCEPYAGGEEFTRFRIRR